MVGVKLLFLTSLLFALTGATAHVAGDSLPGDAFFMLKTELENVHIRFADSPDVRARLHLQYASRRVIEFSSLLAQGRYADLTLASSEFARNIQQASSVTKDLAQSDPARGAVLYREILVVLRTYTALLSSHLGNIPGDIQPIVEKVESASQPPIPSRYKGTVSLGVPTSLPTMTPILIILATGTPASPLSDPQIGVIEP
jgi:hypothetical protein